MDKESVKKFEERSKQFIERLEMRLETAMEGQEDNSWKSNNLELSKEFKEKGDFDRAFLLMATEESTTIQDLMDFNQEYVNHKVKYRDDIAKEIEKHRATIKIEEEMIADLQVRYSAPLPLINSFSDPVWKVIEIKSLPAYLEEFPVADINNDTIREDLKNFYAPSVAYAEKGMSLAADYKKKCKALEPKPTGTEADYAPEPEVDTIDRSSCLDKSLSEYAPKWILNNTSGNVIINGTSGTVWTILHGSDPMLLTEEEYEDFAISSDGRTLVSRGKIKIVDEGFMKADAFFTDRQLGGVSSL